VWRRALWSDEPGLGGQGVAVAVLDLSAEAARRIVDRIDSEEAEPSPYPPTCSAKRAFSRPPRESTTSWD